MKTKPNLPALYELRDLMKTVKPEQFDQDKFSPGFDNCGCVAHWYCKSKNIIMSSWGSLDGMVEFDLTWTESDYLFGLIWHIQGISKSEKWPLPPFTPEGAVIRIEHIISIYEKKPLNRVEVEDNSKEFCGYKHDTEFLEKEVVS